MPASPFRSTDPDGARTFPAVSGLVAQAAPPPVLEMLDGTAVTASNFDARRDEVRQAAKWYEFGYLPPRDLGTAPGAWTVLFSKERFGTAGDRGRLLEIDAQIGPPGAQTVGLLVGVPPGPGPHPFVIMPNGKGNHAMMPDTEIRVARNTVESTPRGEDDNLSGEYLISRGYGFVTFCDDEVIRDDIQGPVPATGEVFRYLFTNNNSANADARDAGYIGMLAWTVSHCVDYLLTRDDVDGARIGVGGHSRRGKSAMWAGVTDERIAWTWAHQSGDFGAQLQREVVSTTPRLSPIGGPHRWVALAWGDLVNAPDVATKLEQVKKLPFDHDSLIAAVAPRFFLQSTGLQDSNDRPEHEWEAAKRAGAAWALFGHTGVSPSAGALPPAGSDVGTRQRFVVRDEGHTLNQSSWEFALNHFDLVPAGSAQPGPPTEAPTFTYAEDPPPPPTAPDPITGLSLTDNADGTFTASWDARADVETLTRLEYRVDGGAAVALDRAAVTVTVEALVGQRTFEVRAVNAQGPSAWRAGTVTVTNATGPPPGGGNISGGARSVYGFAARSPLPGRVSVVVSSGVLLTGLSVTRGGGATLTLADFVRSGSGAFGEPYVYRADVASTPGTHVVTLSSASDAEGGVLIDGTTSYAVEVLDPGRLYVEDLEEVGALPVFVDGWTVLLRYVSRAGGGLDVANVWGQVSDYQRHGAHGQSWAFTTLQNNAPAGAVVNGGAVVIAFGFPGDGIQVRTVLDGTAGGYIQGYRWYDDDGDGVPDRYEVDYRLGDLAGIARDGIGPQSGHGLFTERLVAYVDADNYMSTVGGRMIVVVGGRSVLTAEPDGTLWLGDQQVQVTDAGVSVETLTQFAPAGTLLAPLAPEAWGLLTDGAVLPATSAEPEGAAVRLLGSAATRQAVPYAGQTLRVDGALSRGAGATLRVHVVWLDAQYAEVSRTLAYDVGVEQGTDHTFNARVTGPAAAVRYRVYVETNDEVVVRSLRAGPVTTTGDLSAIIADPATGKLTANMFSGDVINGLRIIARELLAATGTVDDLTVLGTIDIGGGQNIVLDALNRQIVLTDSVKGESVTFGVLDFDVAQAVAVATDPGLSTLAGSTVAQSFNGQPPQDVSAFAEEVEGAVTVGDVYTVTGTLRAETSTLGGVALASASLSARYVDGAGATVGTPPPPEEVGALSTGVQVEQRTVTIPMGPAPAGAVGVVVRVERDADARSDSGNVQEPEQAEAEGKVSALGLTREASDADFFSPAGVSLTDDAGNQVGMKREGGELLGNVVRFSATDLLRMRNGAVQKSTDNGATWQGV